MADLEALYKDLDSYIAELGGKFVDRFIPADPIVLPSEYAHDVRAYCILCHAAFEDFMESVALAVACHAVDQWINTRKINDVIPSLLAWNGAKLEIDIDPKSPEKKPFEYLRVLIVSAKESFSKEIHNNHGVSIKYLRKLLIPVAIEIKSDIGLLNSLDQLAKGRGDYAHTFKIKAILAPEDAKKYVRDVLTICDDVRAKALANMVF